jgi:glutamine amidotransferase
MKVGILDTGGANHASLFYALQRLGAEGVFVDSAAQFSSVQSLIMPGVGHAAVGMDRLLNRKLKEQILNFNGPVLGICLGMQLLFETLEEGGVTGLGILPGRVEILRATSEKRVPHMGWNTVKQSPSQLWQSIGEDSFFYFTHSYACFNSPASVGEVTSPFTFCAAIAQQNFYGTQFHPEKSGLVGEQLLRNFLSLQGEAQ